MPDPEKWDGTFTVADVLALQPCWDDAEERLTEIAATRPDGWRISNLLRLRPGTVSTGDLLWVALGLLEALGPRDLVRQWSYATAERACRVHAADALAKVAGFETHVGAMREVRITDEASARAAARAASAAAGDAASAAAWAAGAAARDAGAAARDASAAASAAAWAARAAAGAAARDAEERLQLRDLKRMCKEAGL